MKDKQTNIPKLEKLIIYNQHSEENISDQEYLRENIVEQFHFSNRRTQDKLPAMVIRFALFEFINIKEFAKFARLNKRFNQIVDVNKYLASQKDYSLQKHVDQYLSQQLRISIEELTNIKGGMEQYNKYCIDSNTYIPEFGQGPLITEILYIRDITMHTLIQFKIDILKFMPFNQIQLQKRINFAQIFEIVQMFSTAPDIKINIGFIMPFSLPRVTQQALHQYGLLDSKKLLQIGGIRPSEHPFVSKYTFRNLTEIQKYPFKKTIFIGQVDPHGDLNGLGRILIESGEIQEGQFQNNQLNGWGRVTDHLGKQRVGIWQDGILIKDWDAQVDEYLIQFTKYEHDYVWVRDRQYGGFFAYR